MTITLAWPDRRLSPNARSHWATKAKVTRLAREYAWAVTLNSVGPKTDWNAASLSFTFCPPDKRRRDLDNCISSTKAHRDGIADALGVDDSRFQCIFAFGAPVKGGAVHIEILPLQ